MTSEPKKIDQVVLAVLWLTAHREGEGYLYTAWKGLDWDALKRLLESGLITNPHHRNKSITFTQEGAEAAEEAFTCLCGGMTCKKVEDRSTNTGGESIVPRPTSTPSPLTERHPFPTSALDLLESVPEEVRPEILSNVYCGHCCGARRIVDFTGIPNEYNDLVLRGFCADCGHVIVRVIETGETFPPLRPLSGFR